MMRRGRRLFCFSKIREGIESKVEYINSQVLRPMDRYNLFIPRVHYATPLVILLGNHSAGKSTFINSLLGCEEQQTGVAPTDDGFTVIRRGDVDLDEDGPTAIGTPHNGFSELKEFGPSFVNHFRLKTRKLPATSRLPHNMMIVDSPGMIDSPTHSNKSRTSIEAQNRGYDFLGATRWFAQRADVILLLFDPANPGTTGETLDVLTQSLADMQHKFLILLNKSDSFDRVSDFARAYGALCWNLSKVIPQKDLPRIYTTFTDTTDTHRHIETSAMPLKEMERERDSVIQELLKAPIRRLDNLISEMEETTERIRTMSRVTNAIKSALFKQWVITNGSIAAAIATIPASLWILLFPVEPGSILLTLLLSGAGIGGIAYPLLQKAKALESSIVQNIDDIWEAVNCGKETADSRQRWVVVKKLLLKEISSYGIHSLQSVSKKELKRLDEITRSEIPQLREQISKFKHELLARDQKLKDSVGPSSSP